MQRVKLGVPLTFTVYDRSASVDNCRLFIYIQYRVGDSFVWDEGGAQRVSAVLQRSKIFLLFFGFLKKMNISPTGGGGEYMSKLISSV